MKILIIEDEKPATENLVACLRDIDSSIEIAGTTASVAETVRWFHANPAPQLILMDIELADGLSFNIFNEYAVTSPVIFTTAYNKYLMQAFEYNSIDYLLKPIECNKLSNTIKKYKNLQQHFLNNHASLIDYFNNSRKAKSRIVVKRGTEFQTVKTEDICYFFTEHKLVFAVHKDNKKYLCDISTLTEMEETLDKTVFFRANRQCIVNANYIVKFRSIDKSKISIDLALPTPDEIIISQENAPVFKKWINDL